MVPRIDEGKLEKEEIELFLKQVLEEMIDSRSLMFFLTAERKYFESRKNRDSTKFKELLGVVFGTSKVALCTYEVNNTEKELVR